MTKILAERFFLKKKGKKLGTQRLIDNIEELVTSERNGMNSIFDL